MVCSFRKLQVERVSRYGAGLQKSIYCFMVQKDFQKDTINCKGNVIFYIVFNIVKFRMLLIFSNDFCYLYYELKMRKHGWNRMLNCTFTKNWHLRLDKFGSCQFSRNATKHIKLKMILQTMSVYPYVSVLTRQRN